MSRKFQGSGGGGGVGEGRKIVSSQIYENMPFHIKTFYTKISFIVYTFFLNLGGGDPLDTYLESAVINFTLEIVIYRILRVSTDQHHQQYYYTLTYKNV